MFARECDPVVDIFDLRHKERVFSDRAHAGEMLAGLLDAWSGTNAIVLAVPTGGVPVASSVALLLGLELDVVPVAKIAPEFDIQVGYGALAFDGTLELNEAARVALGISDQDRDEAIVRAQERVRLEVEALRGNRPFPDLVHRPVILVDDGIASGFTIDVALRALHNRGARSILVATPTSHTEALRRVGPHAEGLYVANLRSGAQFRVADAYQRWTEVTLQEAGCLLEETRRGRHES